MKTRWNWLARSIAVGAVALACFGVAQAQNVCEVINTNVDVDFGVQSADGLASGSLDAVSSTSVTVQCSASVGRRRVLFNTYYDMARFRVCLGLGSGSGGSSGGSRQMKNGGNSISYQLYRDSQRTIPIGLIGGNPSNIYDQDVVLATTEPSAYRSIQITLGPFYGRIPAGQSAAPSGAYSSTFASPGDIQIRWSSTWVTGENPPSGSNVPPAPVPCPQAQDTLNHPGFQAKVNIVPGCTLVSVPTMMDFGTHSTPGEVVDTAAGLAVRCTSGTGYTIGLDRGNTFLGGQRNMRLVGGSIMNLVPYNLYRNAARTQVWRDSPTADVVQGTGSGQNQTYTIYGRATVPDPIPAVGQFQDTVVIKLYY